MTSSLAVILQHPRFLVNRGPAQTLDIVFRNSTKLSRAEKEFHVAHFFAPSVYMNQEKHTLVVGKRVTCEYSVLRLYVSCDFLLTPFLLFLLLIDHLRQRRLH